MRLIDLAGQRFGRLRVVERANNLDRPGRKSGRVAWRCHCDCGNDTITETVSLRYGVTKSCGCLRREISRETCSRRKKTDEVSLNCRKIRKAQTTSRSWIKNRYGITVEQYEQMLKQQDGRCAICNNPMVKPNVDHDHDTNRVRKLLCHDCNVLLGYARERVDVLRAAADYLEEFWPTSK